MKTIKPVKDLAARDARKSRWKIENMMASARANDEWSSTRSESDAVK